MTRRRQANEGGISSYETKAGVRYRIDCVLPSDPLDPLATEPQRIIRGGFTTKALAAKAIRDILVTRKVEPVRGNSSTTIETYMSDWLDGLDVGSTTLAGYRKTARLHVIPYIGELDLVKVTPTRLAQLYRKLETSGRKDKPHVGEGLSKNTVHKVHTLIGAMLDAAMSDGLLVRNSARHKDARPPSTKDIKAAKPEINPWTSEQAKAFLDWLAVDECELAPAWSLGLSTGMRRGEILGLKWRDVDPKGLALSVRRTAVLVKDHGKPERIEIKPPKSGKSRVVTVDEGLIRELATWKADRGGLSLSLVMPDAYVFGDMAGNPRHPERFSRTFQSTVARCRKAQIAKATETADTTGRPVDFSELLPEIRLHDLRHSHATMLLQAGVNPKIVQERLGHASITITMDIYSHVMPTMQAEAANVMANALR